MTEQPAPALPGPRALILMDSVTRTALPEEVAALQQRGAHIYEVDYRDLESAAADIRHYLATHEIDFVLFSRNDQVFDKRSIGALIRALTVGYSSFSGIDVALALEQARICLRDYLAGNRTLSLPPPDAPAPATPPPPPHDGAAGSFSLVFDLEQLGGACFGLPRILELLARYQARATFFMTSFVQHVYHDVLDVLLQYGHEVGLHGQYHEYLGGLPLEQQMSKLAAMQHDFARAAPITGANFIFRMDALTIEAMAGSGLHYFVVFDEHTYHPFRYRRVSLRPMLMSAPQSGKTLWMVPVAVETNNRPWPIVKNMLDAALATAQAEAWPHLTLLLHPFRDGSLAHLHDLERILDYLCTGQGYRACPIREMVQHLPGYDPASFIYYGLEHEPAHATTTPHWRAWWHQRLRYQQRISTLYHLLEQRGARPALCVEPPAGQRCYGVYPWLPAGTEPAVRYTDDPLLLTPSSNLTLDGQNDGSQRGLHAFVPTGYGADVINAARVLHPHTPHDYAGLLPEVALRVAYRLSGDRHIF